MPRSTLPKAPRLSKHRRESNADWQYSYETAMEWVDRQALDILCDHTCAEIAEVTAGQHAVFAWSGGKESIILGHLCERVGLTEGVCCITAELEYPAIMDWYAQHTPDGVNMVQSPHDLAWLAEHGERNGYLFPIYTFELNRWAEEVWQREQTHYLRTVGATVLITGRRTADSNNCGNLKTGTRLRKDGILTYAPIRAWSHLEILAYCRYHHVVLPPWYGWKYGWLYGSQPWPMRGPYTQSIRECWADLFAIDPTIVERAARAHVETAERFLKGGSDPLNRLHDGSIVRIPFEEMDAFAAKQAEAVQ